MIPPFLGFLSSRPWPRKAMGAKLVAAVQSFGNLNSIEILPRTFHEDMFTDFIHELSSCSFLRDLSVNSACTNETTTSKLIMISNLEKLTIMDSTRAILNVLPDWLGRLSGTLAELHLKVSLLSPCNVVNLFTHRFPREIVAL